MTCKWIQSHIVQGFSSDFFLINSVVTWDSEEYFHFCFVSIRLTYGRAQCQYYKLIVSTAEHMRTRKNILFRDCSFLHSLDFQSHGNRIICNTFLLDLFEWNLFYRHTIELEKNVTAEDIFLPPEYFIAEHANTKQPVYTIPLSIVYCGTVIRCSWRGENCIFSCGNSCAIQS